MSSARALRDVIGPAALAAAATLSFLLGGCGDGSGPADGGSDDPLFLRADISRIPADLPPADLLPEPDLAGARDGGDGGAAPDLLERISPCADGQKGGGETDTDCGGPDCAPCADTRACAMARDCASGVCGGGTCSAPACGDGVKNGGEADIDCGGGVCPVCAAGKACVGGADCAGKSCIDGVCAPARALATLDFAGPRVLPGLPGAVAIARGDLDRDGKLDLVVPWREGGVASLGVHPGRGDGTFGARLDTRLAAPALSLALADLDGDGILDAACGATDAIYVLPGDGKGGFKAAIKLAASGAISALGAADLDGDGDIDLAWIDPGSASVRALYNDGRAAFPGKSSIAPCGAMAANYRALAVRDLDGDGRADAAVACGDGWLRVMASLGTSWSAPLSLLVAPTLGGLRAVGLTSADADGDGRSDLILGEAQQGRTLVLWNETPRAMPPPPPADLGAPPDLASPPDLLAPPLDDGGDDAGMLDPDGGVADLAVPDLATPPDLATRDLVSPPDLVARDLAMRDGAPPVDMAVPPPPAPFVIKFGPVITAAAPLTAITVADVTDDGRADVVVAGGNAVTIGRNAGGGTFMADAPVPVGNDPLALCAGDWNGDGRGDLAVGHDADGMALLLLAKVGGGFDVPPSYTIGLDSIGVLTGDWNGDRQADLVAAGGGSLEVYLNRGGGTLAAPGLPLTVGASLTGLARADLDGDGKLDLLAGDFGLGMVNKRGGVITLRGDGAGGFGPPALFLDGTGVRALAVADLDRDGRPDVAAADFTRGGVRLLEGGEARGFPRRGAVPGAAGTSLVALGDLDRDGFVDAVVGNLLAGTLLVHRGQAGGGFGAGAPVGPAGATSIALGDLDGDGLLDLVAGTSPATLVGPSIHALRGDGKGGFAAALVTTANRAAGLCVADLDLDGTLDLAVAGSQALAVLRGSGNGRFAAPLWLFAGRDPNGVAAADLDGDGKPELVTSAFSYVQVLANRSR